MREGWEKVTYNDVLIKIIGGGTPSKSKEEYWNGNIPWCSVKDMVNETYSLERTEDTITEVGLKNSSSNLIPKGTVITATRMGLGRAFINKVDFAINQDLKALVPNNKIDNHYLYLSMIFNREIIESLGTGATVKGIKLETLRSIELYLPPLLTQQKIAEILSAYDDLIENNLRRIQILEEMAQQTYEEWFVRMRYPGYENDAVNLETGLPEGWIKVKLKDSCILVMGQSPKSEFYNEEQKGLPFHQGIKDFGMRFPTHTTWSTEGSRIAKENSILFSVRAPVGRINVAKEEIILGRGLASINHKKNLNSFVFYQLQTIFFEDNLIGGGAIFSSVTKKDVENIELIYANGLSEKYNDLALSIDDEIKNLTNQNHRLRESRDLLLPRLMMGLADAEEILG